MQCKNLSEVLDKTPSDWLDAMPPSRPHLPGQPEESLLDCPSSISAMLRIRSSHVVFPLVTISPRHTHPRRLRRPWRRAAAAAAGSWGWRTAPTHHRRLHRRCPRRVGCSRRPRPEWSNAAQSVSVVGCGSRATTPRWDLRCWIASHESEGQPQAFRGQPQV